ncbi:MAG: hypothetical protein AAF652_15770 [Cyanobacteria bacterium P01_C01_bin.72]
MKINFVSWRMPLFVFVALSGWLGAVARLKAMPLLISDQFGSNTATNAESCPQDIQTLTASLLEDLPSYSNRVIQRTQDLNQAAGIENYILTASQAEFEPLGLPRLQYGQIAEQDPEQIFFTVLERQYINSKIVDIQTYHWLFLSQTDRGWRTVMLFSRFGNSRQKPPTPPRETTNGIIGRGVQLWLRDCRAKIN